MSSSDFLTIASATMGLLFILWCAASTTKTTSRNIYDQQASNKRWSYFLVSVFCVFIGFIGLGVDVVLLHMPIPALGINMPAEGAFVRAPAPHLNFPLATAIAVLIAFGMSWYNYQNAPAMVLTATGARRADPAVPAEKQFLDIVQEMATAAGLPVPKAYIVQDPDPNAFATGTSPEDGHIAVTSTLLALMNREELEGVISHEMSHLRNQDTELLTLVVALAGAAALLADWSGRSMMYGRGGRSSSRDEGKGAVLLTVLWLVGIILAPIISQLMTLAISRHREYLADASGAELTRNPLSLANALEKIKKGMVVPDQALSSHSFGHLCIADPKPDGWGDHEGFVADIMSSHPPIDKRIAALKEMAYQYQPQQQQGEDAAA